MTPDNDAMRALDKLAMRLGEPLTKEYDIIRTALQRSADYEHLKEEKRIQDGINQAWATSARNEYGELKAQVDGLVKALSDLIDDLKERAKWMHFEPQEGGTVLPCGNGVYIAAEQALQQFNSKEIK